MEKLIKRLCACGCGGITNYGKKVIHGHNRPSKKTKLKMAAAAMCNTNAKGNKGKHHSEKTKQNLSLSKMGNTYGKANRGRRVSEETKIKMSLSSIKHNPDYKYCGAWQDKEYLEDLRKDYCENFNCKGNYKQLGNHHIDLNKKHCHPSNVMTLCNSCHTSLHNRLGLGTNHKDYRTIIRKDRITYIHKKTRKKIILERRKNEAKKVDKEGEGGT